MSNRQAERFMDHIIHIKCRMDKTKYVSPFLLLLNVAVHIAFSAKKNKMESVQFHKAHHLMKIHACHLILTTFSISRIRDGILLRKVSK